MTIVTCLLLLPAADAAAQDHSTEDEEPVEIGEPAKYPPTKEDNARKLAQGAQNPISKLISVPFQFNFNGGTSPFDRTQTVLNIQPVLPIPLSDHYTLVTRWILPFVGQPNTSMSTDTTWGFSDFNPQLYLAIEVPHGFTIGPGVSIVTPTASDAVLGAGKWSAGPSLVVVWIGGSFVAGFLVNNVWSINGDSTRAEVSSFFLQPFINWNLPHGSYITTAPEITQNWNHSAWTVPIGAGVGKIQKLLDQPVNFSVQAYGDVTSPSGAPDYTVRVQLQLLFPLAAKKK